MKNRTVLFVDDEPNILSSIKRGLIDEDYRCLFAESGIEALSLLELEEVCVIVTDMKMPVMDGLKLLKIVREKYPNIVRIVLSGYTQLPQVLAAVNQADIFKFITKPWKMEEEFIYTIRQAIEYYELHEEREELRKALEKRNLMYQNIMRTTEKKLRLDKAVFENIRKMGEFTFASLESYIEKSSPQSGVDSGRMLGQLGLAKELYGDYISIVQASSVEFGQKNLAADLEKYLLKIPDIQSLTVKTEGQDEVRYFGNYRIIFYIMHNILKYMLTPVEKYILLCNIIEGPQGSSGKLPVMIEVRFENRIGMDRNSETWELVKDFIGEVCRLADTKMEMHIKENNVSLKLIMDFLDSAVQTTNSNP
ncbi:MAG: response regulator [Pseudomonadota bacterium]